MGIGIGGENWLTLAMRWFYGVETEPAEMPVLYRQDDVDDIRSELIDKIDRLMMDRKSLFTVAEVNKHAEYASAAIRQTVDSFRKENETLRYENERLLDALAGIRKAHEDIAEELIGIPDKKSSQSFLLNDEKV